MPRASNRSETCCSARRKQQKATNPRPSAIGATPARSVVDPCSLTLVPLWQDTGRHAASDPAPSQILQLCPELASYLCSYCNNGWYCSRRCQIAHWPTHSTMCTRKDQPYSRCASVTYDTLAETHLSWHGPGRTEARRSACHRQRRAQQVGARF